MGRYDKSVADKHYFELADRKQKKLAGDHLWNSERKNERVRLFQYLGPTDKYAMWDRRPFHKKPHA